ncbi:MAG TPA: aquaporin Z [Hyphomicrobiaceae bacterium]|jgi:aquaporin Z
MNVNTRALVAEAVGTFALVAAICGGALFSAPSAGLMAPAFAIGISVIAMAYAVGHISGGHFNPAVTLGLIAAGRFDSSRALPYIIAQCVGGIAAALIFYMILSGALGGGKWNTFTAASNTYGGPGQFGLGAVFLIEVVTTALFLIVIVGVTSRRASAGFAPLAIGLTLTMCHLISIPVSNTSVNPARSTATAIFGGIDAVGQLWVFWVAPILGGIIGGVIGRYLQEE